MHAVLQLETKPKESSAAEDSELLAVMASRRCFKVNRSYKTDCTSSLTDSSRTLAIHRSVSCIVRSASDTAFL